MIAVPCVRQSAFSTVGISTIFMMNIYIFKIAFSMALEILAAEYLYFSIENVLVGDTQTVKSKMYFSSVSL